MIRSWKTFVLVVASSLSVVGTAPAAEDAPARIAAAIRAAQNRSDADPADELTYLGTVVVEAAQNAEKKAAIEQRMIEGLAGAKTRAGKDFFCRQLVVVGSEAAIPALARLLPDAESSHMARYALARIPGPAADAALLQALDNVNDKLKVGLVNSLGVRGCRQAVERIAPLAGGSHGRDLAVAALTALSRIDTEDAVAAVAKARETVPTDLKAAATDAYLTCVARMVRQGKAAEAVTIYRTLFSPEETRWCRVAALTGLVAAEKEKAVSTVLAALDDRDSEVRRVAAATLRYVSGAEATRAIVGSLFSRGEDVQVMLLAVLADRGDAAARPAVLKAADSNRLAVRIAALAALTKLADASVASMLAGRASAAKDPAEKLAARSSLDNAPDRAMNAAIAGLLKAEQSGVRIEAARSLAARLAVDQLAALLLAAEDRDAAVAVEALKSLRTLCGADQMPALVKILLGAGNASRGEAENTIVFVSAKTPGDKNPAEHVLAAVPAANEPEVRASLIRVLGRIAHASALPLVEASIQDARAEVKDAAIRALAEWPTGEPAKVAWAIANDPGASRVHRIVALRGFVNMIARQAQATDDQILDDYARSLRLADRAEEKQLILSKLALVRHRRALELAKQASAEPAVKQSAEAAAASIERLLAAPARVTASKNPEAAFKAIDKDPATRWDTAGVMTGGEWFRIELDEERLITGLVLDTQGSGGDFPRGYEIYVSSSSLGDGVCVVKGQGNSAITKITLPKPVRGRAIKILQTGQSPGAFWSIHELTIESQPVEKK